MKVYVYAFLNEEKREGAMGNIVCLDDGREVGRYRRCFNEKTGIQSSIEAECVALAVVARLGALWKRSGVLECPHENTLYTSKVGLLEWVEEHFDLKRYTLM